MLEATRIIGRSLVGRRAAIAAFDFTEHVGDVRGWEVMPRRDAHSRQLARGGARGHTASGLAEGLAHPFRDRHLVGSRDALEVSELSLVDQHLKPLTHIRSINDSL